MPRPVSPAIRRLLAGARTTSVGGEVEADPYDGMRGPERHRYEELRLDDPESPALEEHRRRAEYEAAAKGEALNENDPLEPEHDADADDALASDEAVRARYRELVDADFRRSTDGMLDSVLADFDHNQRARSMGDAFGAARQARRPVFLPWQARADAARAEREVVAEREGGERLAKGPRR